MSILRSIDEVASTIDLTQRELGRRVLVGIAGAPGAGKSTIAEALVATLGSRAALLPMDGFHLPQHRLVELGRRDRMGAPDTFDVGGFLEVLRALAAGSIHNQNQDVTAPGFDRTVEEPVRGAITIAADTQVVVVEGNYLLLEEFGWAGALPQFDLTFFVDLDDDIRLQRLIDRHVRFGKSIADARDWALGPDERNAVIITATAVNADHIIRL